MSEFDTGLDARLRAAFAPPTDVTRMARDVLAQSGVVVPAARVSRLRLLRAVAAILIVGAGLGWFGWRASHDAPRDDGLAASLPARSADELYALVSGEIGGPLACTSPDESTQLVTGCGGERLDYRGGARVPLQGPFLWPANPAATVLGGHWEGRVVVVVIEPAHSGSFEPAAGDLFVHRRELDTFVLYEVSAAERPVCLEEFGAADER